MKKLLVAFGVVLVMTAMLSLAIGQASKSADNNAVAAITQLLNDMAKADLAGDASWYQNTLTDDWTGGNSRGTWDTKASILADMKDTKNNKTNSERISDVKVRVRGDVAIATFKNSYDALIKGQRYTRIVICTSTFVGQNGAWKDLADHCSQTAN